VLRALPADCRRLLNFPSPNLAAAIQNAKFFAGRQYVPGQFPAQQVAEQHTHPLEGIENNAASIHHTHARTTQVKILKSRLATPLIM